ncbi:16967_t:CDS:2 [Gigaspora margarita]|uniref:16967_t:CDS:1 n=1 Tax=Gigaspora margarita TaxID=4874 RepID=A0ABN7U315_GIGMA|nr:16967_t:CDS:2 [Gigaspora margarita]
MTKSILSVKIAISCLPTDTPPVEFPGSAYDSKVNSICAGWYIPHVINIPRKAFTLPRKQLTDIVAHECGHADPEASEKDRKNFSDFINEPYKARYSLEEEIPNPISDYRLDPDEYKYDPNED